MDPSTPSSGVEPVPGVSPVSVEAETAVTGNDGAASSSQTRGRVISLGHEERLSNQRPRAVSDGSAVSASSRTGHGPSYQHGDVRPRRKSSNQDRSIFAQALDLVGLTGDSDTDSSGPNDVLDTADYPGGGSATNSTSDSSGGYLDGLQSWVKKVLTTDMSTQNFPLGRYAVDENGNAVPLAGGGPEHVGGGQSLADAVRQGRLDGEHAGPSRDAAAQPMISGSRRSPVPLASTTRSSARTTTTYGAATVSVLPPAQGGPAQPGNSKCYTVTGMDTLAGIALKHGMTPAELKKGNRLLSSQLYPGQVLYVRDDQSRPLERPIDEFHHDHSAHAGGAAAHNPRSTVTASATSTTTATTGAGSSSAKTTGDSTQRGDGNDDTEDPDSPPQQRARSSSGLFSKARGVWKWEDISENVQYLGPNGVEDGTLRITPLMLLFLPAHAKPGSSASIVSLPIRNIPSVSLVRSLNKVSNTSFLRRLTGRAETEMKCLQVTYQAMKTTADGVSVTGDIHHFVGGVKGLRRFQAKLENWIQRLADGQRPPADPEKVNSTKSRGGAGSPYVDVDKQYPGLVGSATTALYELGAFEPTLDNESNFLVREDVLQLHADLPRRCQQRDWELLYSTQKHGISLQTLYRKSQRRYSLLCIHSTDGQVFGALASEPWRVHHAYFGSGESFVWNFVKIPPPPDATDDTPKRALQAFHWSRKNNYFMLGSEDSIAFGGGGHFALYLDADLATGSSGACSTFDSECLTKDTEFNILEVEVWGFKGVQ